MNNKFNAITTEHKTMILIAYGLVFWSFALITILHKSKSPKWSLIRTIIKPLPAISGALFVVMLQPTLSPFLLVAIALIFCGLGDIAMESNILPGLGLFLVAHIIYSSSFIMQSVSLGLTLISSGAFIICLGFMLGYILQYHKYLKTSEREVAPVLIRAVLFYALVISLTLSSSLLLWLSSGSIYGLIPFLGAVLFVTSDSIIGIREFHHSIKYQEPLILGTYYLAIFFLSMIAVVYTS